LLDLNHLWFSDVSIEMSLAKDQSLTVVIHGKDKNVMQARREIVAKAVE
jgi:hypothetical protein